MSAARVPRFAGALLRRALPTDVRDDILGDLEERFVRDTAAAGGNLARWRYRRAALTFSIRFLFERLRDSARALGRIRLSLLDFRIGVRMLARYPLLTIVGGLALSFAIALGAAVFAFISLILWPTLPLPDGDRVVMVRMYDAAASEFENRTSADFLRWQRQSSSLDNLGAGRSLRRNLTTADGLLEPVMMAEVTASMFDLVRLPPVMGRALTDADANPVAPPVMVIGHSLWQKRFGSDPGVVGQSVMLGEVLTTIVGVMPGGLAFPSAHEAWVPLPLNDARVAPRTGPGLMVWGRLKPGVSLTQAGAEMAAIGAQAAANWPATHAHLRPEVKPYAAAAGMQMGPLERMLIGSVNMAVGVLILIISGNVALLMFARAATRESEILVRTALGASRGRVIAQFFSEALVLSAIAAVVGLSIARAGIGWGIGAFTLAANDGQPLPFWFSQPLPPLSIAYGCGLALLAAVVTGVLPALKVTRGLQSRLRETTAGGGGLKFGGVWTVLIVMQVALTMTFPVVTYFVKRDGWQIEERTVGTPLSQVLSARLSRDRDVTPQRYVAAVRELREGLASVPGVSHVTLADKLPLMWHGSYEVEVDEGGAAPKEEGFAGYRISTAAVDPDFFAAFDAMPLAGRLFTLSDYVERPRVAIVNQPFVDRVLGGRNPIGRRVRYTDVGDAIGQRPAIRSDDPWLEIVGLVRDLGMAQLLDPKVAGVYIPLDTRSLGSVYVAARVQGDLPSASKALRQLAARADVTLRVTEVQSLDSVTANALREVDFWTKLLGATSLSVLMLSLTGIYAVMAFAVSRRTREIGIRVALGSDRARVVFAVLRQPLKQVAAGIAGGAILVTLLSGQIVSTLQYYPVIAGYSAVMFGVCLLACLVPARRALRVDPIDALRSE
jgi:putative ABC transport system permease protein